MLDAGAGALAIAISTGLTRQAVLRIREDRAGAEKTFNVGHVRQHDTPGM